MDGITAERSLVVPASKSVLAACLVAVGMPWPVHGQGRATQDGQVQERSAEENVRDAGHPAAGVLKWAKQEVEFLEKSVTDYSANLISRERLNGKLGEYEKIAIKIRHRPFSVYAFVDSPEHRKGDEAIYVEGRNGGKMLVHRAGAIGKLFGTLSLDPAGTMAMRDKRHPITEIGVLNLCREVVRCAESDVRHPESQVRILRGAKVNGRPCVFLEVLHPAQRKHFEYHVLRVFVDEETRIPIRCERYDWPQQAGGAAELVEEYTYLDVKLNNGFTDADFDPRNPSYAFP
jgi:hypothetical protein